MTSTATSPLVANRRVNGRFNCIATALFKISLRFLLFIFLLCIQLEERHDKLLQVYTLSTLYEIWLWSDMPIVITLIIDVTFLLTRFWSSSIHFCFRWLLAFLLKEIWRSQIAVKMVRYFFLDLKFHHFIHTFSNRIAVRYRDLEFLKPLFRWHWSFVIVSYMLVLGIWFELILRRFPYTIIIC